METPEEEKSVSIGAAVVVEAIKEDLMAMGDGADGKDTVTDKALMPPPKSALPRSSAVRYVSEFSLFEMNGNDCVDWCIYSKLF